MTAEHEHHQHAIPQEAVAVRAYELFYARGCEHGHDLDDWFQAEAQLREEARTAEAQPAASAAAREQ